MEYCSNCGNELIENSAFCAECGHSVKRDLTQEALSQNSTSDIPTMNEENSESFSNQSFRSDTPREPFFKSMKSKILTICGLIVIALCIGGYYTVKHMTAPTTVAQGFIDAINKKDTARIKDYINEGQYEIKVNDQEAKKYMDYLHKHPRMITSIADGLLADAAVFENHKSIDSETPTSSDASMKQKGKKWGIFDNYTIQVPTYYTDVTSTMGNTEIYINDKKVGTLKNENEGETFGPFLPGEYTVKAIVNGEYGNVNQVENIDTFDAADQTESIDFDWSDYYVSVYSNDDSAILYVNNKSTNKQIGELDAIGPIPLDGSVTLSAQRKFVNGTKKSNVVSVQENTSEVNLDFPETATDYAYDPYSYEGDDEQAIQDTIYQHYSSITDDDFGTAYDLFSTKRKSEVSLATWSKSLKENSEDQVNNVSVTNVDGDTATAYIEMTSYDDTSKGTIVKDWSGNWNLVRETDGWKLAKANLKKIDSRTE